MSASDGSKFAEAYGLTGDLPCTENCAKLEEWIQLGCSDRKCYISEEKKATFDYDATELPDLKEHNTFITDVLKDAANLNEDGSSKIWANLKDKETKLGVKLSHCLKTGMDNPGHPQIKTVGLVAGDEESFELFKELFDPVISGRHNGYAADAKHVSDMNPDNISATKIDPSGKYVSTTRCRTGRSIRGTRLPPTTTFEERREVEKMIVDGLVKLEGELKGKYLPLHGNKSNATGEHPDGMSLEEEEKLRNNGNLFQEPDSTLLLSSGCGRHWPDARGIFANEAENFFTWVNEEDQMRIVSMEKGDNVHAIFTRFANATKTIQDVLKGMDKDFMYNDHLGFVLTCPSNLGTGLRAGTIVKIPKFSTRDDFKKILATMKLQARGTAGVDSAANAEGKWDISNADRLGFSEVDLVNRFIEGVAQIIVWEAQLEEDKTPDFDADIVALEKKLADKDFKTHGQLNAEAGDDKPEGEKSAAHKAIDEAKEKDAEINADEKKEDEKKEEAPATEAKEDAPAEA